MSRSRLKSPMVPFTCAESEKEDKRLYNRAWRRKERQKLISCDLEAFIPECHNSVQNPWEMAKDGRQRLTGFYVRKAPRTELEVELVEDWKRLSRK